MRSRLFWRRAAAAAGTYASAALGFGATVVALHVFSTETFGRYALVLAATAFFQSLLDLTVEEALVKFGFRYVTREDWGRLRRLFSSAVAFKLVGGVAIVLRGRYDVRAFFLFVSMALRFTAIAVAAPHGLATTIAAMVAAQVVATSAISTAGWV